MALLKYKTLTPTPVHIDRPKITTDAYIPVAVDNNKIPLLSLARYLEGSRWTVNYFCQVLTSDSELRELDTQSPAPNQQYELIKDVNIMVASALSPNYDSDTGISTVTGDGLLSPQLTPNPGDYFTAEASSSDIALYRVINADRKSHNLSAVFSIEYEIVGCVKDIPMIYNALMGHVVREYRYVADRLDNNLNPVVTSKAAEQYRSLGAAERDLITYYCRTFYNPNYGTLVIPGQTMDVCDFYLIDYLMTILDSGDAPELSLIKQPSKNEDTILRQPQFWEMMLSRDYSMMTYINQKMRVVSKQSFLSSTFLHGIYYYNVNYLLYPVDPDTSAETLYPIMSSIIDVNGALVSASPRIGSLADILSQTMPDINGTRLLIKEVLADDHYVLSKDFYAEGSDLSVLEILTKDYLKLLSIDIDKLMSLCDQYRSWGRVEQFYYGPILITLLKAAAKG